MTTRQERVLKERCDRYEYRLRELLAILHRDGGHYAQRHGLYKAWLDAKAIAVKAVVK
jgi:hypothetical protein